METEENKIYFITKVINHRVPIFTFDEYYPSIVIDNLKFYRRKFGFHLYGFAIMPDHYHSTINTMGKVAIEKIKEDMNKFIARQIITDLKTRYPNTLEKLRIDSPYREGHRCYEYRLFQKGRYDFEIMSEEKLLEKIEYMHRNPIRAGLVLEMEEYRFSSARNYVLDDDSLIKLDPLPI